MPVVAVVTGPGGVSIIPSGTVDFQVSTDTVNWTKFGDTKTLENGAAASDSYTPASMGRYLFRAVYSGDLNYNGSQSGDTTEPLTVVRYKYFCPYGDNLSFPTLAELQAHVQKVHPGKPIPTK